MYWRNILLISSNFHTTCLKQRDIDSPEGHYEAFGGRTVNNRALHVCLNPRCSLQVNLTITDVYLGLPLMEAKTASTGVASILGGPFKALYVIIAASVAALLILVVIIILMIKCRSLSSNQYSPDVVSWISASLLLGLRRRLSPAFTELCIASEVHEDGFEYFVFFAVVLLWKITSLQLARMLFFVCFMLT